MTTGCKTTTIFLTILCGLLLTILGLAQDWPPLAWLLLAALLIALPAAAFKIATARRGPLPVDVEEHRTAPPVERREHHVTHVALPSRWDDYDFLFSATVRWYPLEAPSNDPVLNPAGLAVEAVLNRARAITEQREPGRPSLTQHELSGALSRMRPDPTGHLQVMAEDVTLVLREYDQERLNRLAEVRKDKAVWEHQRKYEQSKREYLSEDVLKDTGSAVVWWLAKNDDRIEKTVADLGLLAQLTSAANDTDVPERLRDLIPRPHDERPTFDLREEPPVQPERQPTAADHFEAFLNTLDFTDGEIQRPMLAKQIADIIRTQDQHETAEDILRRFHPPASHTSNDGEPPTSPDDTTDNRPAA
ncbi:hypothetical protein GCM10010358_70500 [Streptomyces minutiscleroticus]|uniref:Uncharacterized protein n=1 Tax=Streptomyces minutiscleroticus TaxID=68238 RepID=A0A918NZB9_9ACTN|nr:hypothetical protein [Streptomyces minutiscleroticus]GGY07278.1 hypothetical protein GCM10010358_70500 [Streptomyces minutiscleroticus]